MTWAEVQAAIALLAAAGATAREVREELARQLDELASDRDVSAEFRDRRAGELRAAAQARLGDLSARVTAARDTVTSYRPDGAGSVERQLLEEQREARAWARAVRMLDAGVSPAELIDTATAERDVATLRALRVELPAWMASRSTSLSPAERASTVEAANRRVDLGLVRSMPDGPELQVLRAKLRAAVTYPLAAQELSAGQAVAAGQDVGLEHAMTVHYLEQEAAPVLAALDGAAAA